ncbi:peptide chain release factor 1 [Kwoniella bestiolae CBS 10118]|uniref:Peptide chain release factor 1 n=1 Tax=Kwoniella bestiolae CBS 10118 TaxID=1296100 RepID=A0A1B9G9M7_9TREE|nr:peptide chain release factor 1 [Kwoniella bestiolae CBS 10118]OCF27742.1 peptide chain release factor 1 [Kwoniella bestiolae CBS 10118]
MILATRPRSLPRIPRRRVVVAAPIFPSPEIKRSCSCGCSKFRPSISSTPSRFRSLVTASTRRRRSSVVFLGLTQRRTYATEANETEHVWCTEIEERQAKLIESAKARVEQYRKTIEQETEVTDVQGQIARAKIQRELGPLAQLWDKYVELRKSIIALLPELEDPDPALRELFITEHSTLCTDLDTLLRDELPSLLLPTPPTAVLPCMISLNAGVGGLESALCTEDIARMYIRFAEKKGWKIEELSKVEGTGGKGGGGIRELTLKFDQPPYGGGGGDGADEIFGLMQWEKGVHRVQRIPVNETMGRIHTSTVAVVVLPIYPDTEESPLVDPKDVKIDVMRARGAGGQHVNRTESAVRLTHIPTGITVSMQDSRSQHQNRAWAWDILRARLSEKKHNEEVEARRASRRDQVKGADRSDKIRTYNFNQDRLTDHRCGFTITGLQNILDGDGLEDVITMMKRDLQERRLEALLQGEEDIDY